MDEESIDTLFPEELTDEAAFALSECLNRLAQACDEKYFAQIRRYINAYDERQSTTKPSLSDNLWGDNPDDDPPF